MTRTIPHRELRNNSSAVLEEVRRGARIEVTNHGEVVAVLVPPGQPDPYPPCRPAKRRGRFSDLPLFTASDGVTTAQIMNDLRGER